MKGGLEDFLKRIEEKPNNETLIDRFISLVLEENGLDRILYLKKLVGLLLNPNPYAALKVAALELQEARKEKLTKEYEIGALKDVESCFLKLDKPDNAALVREEINKLGNETARHAAPSAKPGDLPYSGIAAEMGTPRSGSQESAASEQRRARLHFRLPRGEEDEMEDAPHEETAQDAIEDRRLSSPAQIHPGSDDATQRLDMDALRARSGDRPEAGGKFYAEYEPPQERELIPDPEHRRSSLSQLSDLNLGPNLLDGQDLDSPTKRNPLSVFQPSDLLNFDDDEPQEKTEQLAPEDRTQLNMRDVKRGAAPQFGKSYDQDTEQLQFAGPGSPTHKDIAPPVNPVPPRPVTPAAPGANHVSGAGPSGRTPSGAKVPELPYAAARPQEPQLARSPEPAPPFRNPVTSAQDDEFPLRTMRAEVQPRPPASARRPASPDEGAEIHPQPPPRSSGEPEFGPSGRIPLPPEGTLKTLLDPGNQSLTSPSRQSFTGTSTKGQASTQLHLGMNPGATAALGPSGSPGVDEAEQSRYLRWDLLRERMRLLSGIQINRNHVTEFVAKLLGEREKELKLEAVGLILNFVEGRSVPLLHQRISAFLFEEAEPRAMHQLWVSLRMQELSVQFFVAYLQELMRDQQYRRALNIIHAVLAPGLDGHWYRHSYSILIEIWQRLGLRGWVWAEEDGPLVFCENLARREDLLPSTFLA